MKDLRFGRWGQRAGYVTQNHIRKGRNPQGFWQGNFLFFVGAMIVVCNVAAIKACALVDIDQVQRGIDAYAGNPPVCVAMFGRHRICEARDIMYVAGIPKQYNGCSVNGWGSGAACESHKVRKRAVFIVIQ
jgi:hypothetical protein